MGLDLDNMQAVDTQELQAAVDCGAIFLDDHEPVWWKMVDDWLDMSDCEACVIGQVYGNYYNFLDGLEEKRITSGKWAGGMDANTWAENHGFSLKFNQREHFVDNRARWEALSALWRIKIEERWI
jgi:hypothetical protein